MGGTTCQCCNLFKYFIWGGKETIWQKNLYKIFTWTGGQVCEYHTVLFTENTWICKFLWSCKVLLCGLLPCLNHVYDGCFKGFIADNNSLMTKTLDMLSLERILCILEKKNWICQCVFIVTSMRTKCNFCHMSFKRQQPQPRTLPLIRGC